MCSFIKRKNSVFIFFSKTKSFTAEKKFQVAPRGVMYAGYNERRICRLYIIPVALVCMGPMEG